MALEETLARAEAEIAAGDLGKARDRLHGLSVTYPADLRIRRALGQAYWLLREPAMAGRYWYLEPIKTAEMEEAVKAFQRDRGESPSHMFRAIRLRCGLDQVDPTVHAAYRELAQRAGVTVQEHSRSTPRKRRQAPSASGLAQRSLQYGCMLLLAAFIVLAIVGLLNVIEMVRKGLR